MSKTYVQKSGTGTHFYLAGTTSALTAFSSTTGAGNSIYVCVTGQQTGGYSVASIADTAGNTYARVVQSGLDQSQSRLRTEIWAAHNIAAQASNVVTITHTQTTNNTGHAIALEVSAGGVQSTDQTGSDTDAQDDQSITVTCGGANTDASAIVIAACGGYNDVLQPDITLPSGFTSLYSYVPGASSYRPPARFAYKILSGTETSSVTFDIAVNDVALCAAIASFKEPATNLYLKLLAHSSAASATGVEGVVLNSTRDTVIGEFSGQAFEASLESGEAVLLIPAADITPDGNSLTTSDTPIVFAYNATDSLVGPASATVIEV